MGKDLGPLKDGSKVVVVGGGPAGAGFSLYLQKISKEKKISLNIFLYEGKIYERESHFNQCAGVLSPPIKDILEKELGIEFPHHLVQKEITGYILHSDKNSIKLDGEGEPSYALRRIKFDEYLLNKVSERGIKVINARMVDIEFQEDGVIIYSENGNTKADVLVGAFGLDDGSTNIFERNTSYRRPKCLDSIVTKIHPKNGFIEKFENRIYAFLPSIREIEFGAITPKGNHLTINIAGKNIKSNSMDKFISYLYAKNLLPKKEEIREKELTYFKGKFPISIAKGIYGDRFVIIGDSAGLVRPFKGKGVNSGIITGIKAARTMVEEGISKDAFGKFHKSCEDILKDLPYAKVVRKSVIFFSNLKLMNYAINLAKYDEKLKRGLFDCVSAHRNYRDIVKDNLNLKLIIKFFLYLFK